MSKQITIPFIEYLQDDIKVYNNYDTRVVSTARGILISELDFNEDYVHVEFEEDCAIVWDKKFWRDSETRNGRIREASDKRRKQYYLDEDNIRIVSKALSKKLGITNSEVLKPLATTIIKEGKFDTLPFLNLSELKVKV